MSQKSILSHYSTTVAFCTVLLYFGIVLFSVVFNLNQDPGCGCQKSADTTCNRSQAADHIRTLQNGTHVSKGQKYGNVNNMTRNTGGICFLGVCDTSRGPTDAWHEVEIFLGNKSLYLINSDPLMVIALHFVAFSGMCSWTMSMSRRTLWHHHWGLLFDSVDLKAQELTRKETNSLQLRSTLTTRSWHQRAYRKLRVKPQMLGNLQPKTLQFNVLCRRTFQPRCDRLTHEMR